jgi:hypothetical protein
MHAWNVFFNKSPRGQGEKYLMEQLKRWADNVCMCTFDLPSASEFQGGSRQAGRTQGFHNHVRRPSVITSTEALLFCSNSSCSHDC